MTLASRATSTASGRVAPLALVVDRCEGTDEQHWLARMDAPETLLTVVFEGLTEAEQRAALAAFPGGQRFVLWGAH